MPTLENPTTQIFGAGASSPIASISDGTNQRLCVNTLPAAGVSAQQPAQGAAAAANQLYAPVTNGGSSDLRVAGSAATPITFAWTTATRAATVYAVRIVMSAGSLNFSGAKFAGGTLLGLFSGALNNGLLIKAVAGGTTTTLATIQYNEDFLALNGGAVAAVAGTGSYLAANIVLNQPLAAGGVDRIQAVVQDAIGSSGATYMRMYVMGTLN